MVLSLQNLAGEEGRYSRDLYYFMNEAAHAPSDMRPASKNLRGCLYTAHYCICPIAMDCHRRGTCATEMTPISPVGSPAGPQLGLRWS